MVGMRMGCDKVFKAVNTLCFKIIKHGCFVAVFACVNKHISVGRFNQRAIPLTDINKMNRKFTINF